MTNLTAKDLDVLSHILTGEEMGRIAAAHAERFSALFTLMNGGKK